jgi:O-antigen ligase
MHTEATAGPALRGVDTETLGYAALWCTFAISAFVFIEPAPFDLAMLALLALFLLAGLRIPFDIAPMLALVAAVLVGGLIGIPLSAHFEESAVHIAVTGYLSAIALFIACLVRRDPERTLRVIMSGYLVAAIGAALAGLAGYVSLFDGADDLFTLYGRAKGPFKDPNVFGPFLIVPALFCLLQVFTQPARRTLLPLLGFAILTSAILLSLSRGAWGNFVVSAFVFVLLLMMTATEPRFRARLILWSITAVILAACLVVAALSIESLARIIAERAQLIQAYDAGGHGRFDAQVQALAYILVSPLGVGPRDFASLWGEEAHNVYLSTFLGGGWLAGFANIALVLLTAARAMAAALRPGPLQGIAIIIASSFLGLALEGLIVDTDHWRLFWVLVGMVWGLDLAAGQDRRPIPG